MPIDVESLSNKFQARTSIVKKSNIFSVSEVLAQAESDKNKRNNLTSLDWNMGDPRNGIGKLGRFRDKCGKFVNNKGFQWTVTILLIVNAILMGVMTFDFVKESKTLELQLEYFDDSLLVPFTIEFLLQLLYLGKELRKDLWLVFDGIIVVLFWAFIGAGADSDKFLDAFQIFRVFALVSRVDPLKKLVSAAAKTIPKIGAITLIVFIFFYVFAVFYTNLYSNLYDEGYLDWDYFGRLDFSLLTLFQFMTLDSWTTVVRQVMDSDPYAFIGFFIFVTTTIFVFFSLFIAVVTEAVLATKQKDTTIAATINDDGNDYYFDNSKELSQSNQSDNFMQSDNSSKRSSDTKGGFVSIEDLVNHLAAQADLIKVQQETQKYVKNLKDEMDLIADDLHVSLRAVRDEMRKTNGEMEDTLLLILRRLPPPK